MSKTTVVVVGAGLSGLTIANRVARAGIDVLVLEARERVGGRAWRLPVGDASFEAGCEALDGEHHALRRLAADAGVDVVEGPPWAGDAPSDLEGADLALVRAFEAEIHDLAGRIDPQRPADLEDAGRLDQQTLAGWLVDHGASERVLEVVETTVAVGSSSLPTHEMSLLAYAAKLAAGAAPTGLGLHLRGGPSRLATRLAEELDGRVRTAAPVVGLAQDERDVSVRLGDGTVERADRAVLAVPLTMQRELRFDPPLPEHRALALEEARYGDACKEAALFDPGPAPTLSKVLTADGFFYASTDDPRVLIRFAGAAAAARRVDFARAAGAAPQAVVGVRWSEERWTRGSYLILGPGHLTTWGRRLAEPHGRIHFAGAECSNLPSYMEGAVRAGENAAAELIALGG